MKTLIKINLVIDIRPAEQYSEGHIKGAVNKKIEDLPAYFETGIKPFEYEKIILVCDGWSDFKLCSLSVKTYGLW